jgi:gliding motility-associated lipoprotein GldD
LESDDYFPALFIQACTCEALISGVVIFAGILLLLLISCLLSAGGKALFALSPDETANVKEEKTPRDGLLKQFLSTPQQTHSSIVTARIFLHTIVVAGMIYATGMFVNGWPFAWPGVYVAGVIGLGIGLCLLIGLVPQAIVANNALRIARFTAPLLKITAIICYPLTRLMSSHVYAATYGKNASANESNIISKDTTNEKEMLEEIIHFYNKRADEIMVPRLDVEAIDIKATFKEVMDFIIRTGFSRIPIYEDSEDNIKGVLYGKDLLISIENPSNFQWQSLIRPAYFVPETKKIDDLLDEFRTNKVHIAIVVDEFGCTSGIVTLEDIIEEIVGEIADEYDDDEKLFVTLPDGSYIFEGKIQLNDFFRETDIDPETFGKMTDDVETLGGLLTLIKGTLPHRREVIDYKGYRFRVLEADERRVRKIKFSRIEPPAKKKRGPAAILFELLLISLCVSCVEYTPKPRGFFRIDMPKANYTELSLRELPYSFHVSQYVTVELPPEHQSDDWMNISYPALNAKIYCSYRKINPQTLLAAGQECRELVSRSVQKATNITEQAYENPDIHVYGTLFQVEGETSAPLQFMLTDSDRHFFRGALYYQCRPNPDSLAPVTRYLHDDIRELIESFKWK